MILHNIVLHQLIKERQGKPKLKLSEILLPVDDEVILEFVERVVKSYSSKNPTYGIFEENEITYPFQTIVRKYRIDGDFLGFSNEAMKILEKEIDKHTTTGGYVVFIYYEQNKIDFLTTVMLDNSIQFSVDDVSLTIKKLKGLAIEKLARANRLNINKWENDEDQYLSFIKGTRSVSVYFQNFIGSTDQTSSKQNTEKLKTAIQKYMKANDYTDEQQRGVYNRVHKYAFDKVHKDEDLELDTIAVLIDQQNPEKFTDFIDENEELMVSNNFRVTSPSHLKFLNRILIKEKGYTLEFDREIKGIKIVKEGSDLRIKDVPAEVLQQF